MKFLITGATGLIGQHICQALIDNGHTVNYLTTSRKKIKNKPTYQGFYWNPDNDQIDDECLDEVDKIIHLAGASIAKKWTKTYKQEILKSRVKTAHILYKLVERSNCQITQFVSASAIGIYPSSISQLYNENSTAKADDFLGEVVQQWEAGAERFKKLGVQVSIVRNGLVLAKNNGLLSTLKKSINAYIGACLGSGKQWQSWIHVDDLARLFVFVAEEEKTGVFNGVAPHPVKQKNMIKCIAKKLDKPLFLPPIPEFCLKLMFGDMANMILASQLVQSKRLEGTDFTIKYHHLENALEDLL